MCPPLEGGEPEVSEPQWDEEGGPAGGVKAQQGEGGAMQRGGPVMSEPVE